MKIFFKVVGITSIILFISYFLFFYETEKQKEAKERFRRGELFIKTKKYIIEKLTEKYKVKYKWDTLNYNFGIDYEPVINSENQLIENFDVGDVYKKDSKEYISIRVENSPNYFYFDFPITQEQEAKLRTNVLLIVNISEVEKLKQTLDENNKVKFSNFSSDDLYFEGKGKIVGIYSVKDSATILSDYFLREEILNCNNLPSHYYSYNEAITKIKIAKFKINESINTDKNS